MLLFLAVALLLKNFKSIKRDVVVSLTICLAALVIPVPSIIVVSALAFADSISVAIQILAIFIMFGIIAFLFFLLDKISAASEARAQVRLREQEREHYQIQHEMMQESLRQIKSIRHDMKAHVATIHGYAATFNAAPITEYCNILLGGMDEAVLYADTGNIAIDSIVNYKLKNVRVQNINANVCIDFPQTLDIELSDIAVILGNLLDNALDAVARIEDRRIVLDIEYSRKVLYVMAKNTFDGVVEYAPANRLPVSRKAGREHGYGFGNVMRTVDKYRGHLTIEHEGGEFTVTLMLLCG